MAPRSLSGEHLTKASPELAAWMGVVPRYGEFYPSRASLTHGEFADILSVASPEVAAMIACRTDVATADGAVELLNRAGRPWLVRDNSAQIAEIAARRLDLGTFLDAFVETRGVWVHTDTPWADLLEAHASKSLAGWDEVLDAIADGTASWAFIKTVGVSNFRRFNYDLLALEGALPAEDVKALIRRASDKKLTPTLHAYNLRGPSDQLRYLISAAKMVGTDIALRLRCPGHVPEMQRALGEPITAEEALFADQFLALARARLITTVIGGPPGLYGHEKAFSRRSHEYFLALGPDAAELAIEAVVAGLGPEQAREVHFGGQPPALIDGWL